MFYFHPCGENDDIWTLKWKGLLRLQQIYQGLKPGNETFQVETVKRITNVSTTIDFLRTLEELNRWSKKFIVLDCPTEMAKEIVVSHVRDVSLGRRTYHYLLSGLVSIWLCKQKFYQFSIEISFFCSWSCWSLFVFILFFCAPILLPHQTQAVSFHSSSFCFGTCTFCAAAIYTNSISNNFETCLGISDCIRFLFHYGAMYSAHSVFAAKNVFF